MNTCETLRDDLLAYRDHELPAARRWFVRWHLAHCAVCREELAIMEQITTDLLATEATPATLDAGLRTRILSSVPDLVADPADARSGDAPRLQGRARSGWWEMGAIGAAVVLFAMTLTTHMGSRLRAGFSTAANQISTTTGDDTETTTHAAAPSSGFAGGGGAATINRDGAISGSDIRNGPLASSAEAPSGYASRLRAQSDAQFQHRSFLGAGGPGRSNRIAAAPTSDAVARAMGGGSTAADLPSALRRVHKEARIAVAVAKVEEGADSVESYVKSAGGFIADNTLSTGGDGLKTATLTVRVPVRQFETVLGQIAKLGDVKAKNVSGEDITEKFSDADQANRVLSSELGVKESQLKAALDRAAKEKKHLVEVPWQQRAEVRELRILAAQAQARLDLMKKISDLSNITVELQEQPRPAQQTGLLQDMSDTGYAAFDTFILAARVPLNLAIWILAYCPLWIPLVVAYRYYSRAHLRDTPNP